ncbi:MAG: hypothetical protein Q4Q03_08540, partial [Bowdeniella nasicola]|nr:hypothetical protein [Bowdeniella nasicola]
DAVAIGLAAAENLHLLGWSHHMPNGDDHAYLTNLATKLEPEAIILNHDGRSQPRDALMRATVQLLLTARQRTLRSVTVSTLAAQTCGTSG